ncbi:type IV secretion system protein VirB5 [Sinorhizobium terangae]|uniref:Type IV secretion system protein VirB5 n=1 Tax=Sinorhizobium terangae TaxID=110322 RepID=A0A6N7LCS1_SINTE|nr:type IV secretion system protein VirB5 [Sinorhizobium terangae]MBB4189048.1 type IV secretion system protein VirB5 [Sinorhizobium terangae]MQX15661.1 type IV secretion system protein VirB5 [Sinorhizobium terangae]
MKIAQLTATAIAACLLLRAPARAQLLVSDPVTEAQSLLTAGNTAQNVVHTLALLEQTVQMVQMFTTSFGVTGLLTSLNQPSRYPSTDHLEKQMFAARAPASPTARAIASDAENDVVWGNDAQGTVLREQIIGSSNAAGAAAGNLDAMDHRLRENASTLNQLSGSRNIMQATVTNGLILKQIHDAIIQNTQATSLLTMTAAQARLQEAEEATTQRHERQETAKMFATAP